MRLYLLITLFNGISKCFGNGVESNHEIDIIKSQINPVPYAIHVKHRIQKTLTLFNLLSKDGYKELTRSLVTEGQNYVDLHLHIG